MVIYSHNRSANARNSECNGDVKRSSLRGRHPQAFSTSDEFVLANAYQIKHIPGRKTDVLDSEWIAKAMSQGFDRTISNLLRR